MTIRLIGDVHGKYSHYCNLIQNSDYSIVLGDFGFDYSILEKIDSTKHKILAGNHDNYDHMDSQHFLGDFGNLTVDGREFFFIRGGFSIDKAFRIPKISWWKEEELSYRQMNDCAEQYEKVKPNIVISHECPSEIVSYVCNNALKLQPSQTSGLLNHLWTIYHPKQWYFAHYHTSWRGSFEGTDFHCLDELESLDI